MALPLAARELTRSGKQLRTYIIRMAAVGLSCAILHVVCFTSLLFQVPLQELVEFIGEFLAGISTLFQYIVVFGLAPLFAAGLIAQEKRDQTLPLLLIADFRGWDIFFSKFLVAFLQAELLVLSPLPLLAFASMFGGVSVPDMTVQVILFSAATFTICAIGLFCSTIARRPAEALFLTAVFLTVWLVLTGLIDALVMGVSNLSTLRAMSNLATLLDFVSLSSSAPHTNIVFAIRGLDLSANPTSYWMVGLVVTLAVGALACAGGIFLLPRQAQEPTRERRVATTKRGRRRRRNPLAHLVVAGLGEYTSFFGSLPIRLILGLVLAVAVIALPGLGLLMVAAVICYDVTSSLAATRKSPVLDEILITPIGDKPLARAMFGMLVDRSWPFYPALLVADAAGMALLVLMVFQGATDSPWFSFWGAGVLTELILSITLLMFIVRAQLRCIIAAAAFVSTLGFKAPTQTLITLGLLLIQHTVGFAILMPVVSIAFLLFFALGKDGAGWFVAPMLIFPVTFLLLYVGGHYVFFQIFAHDLAYAMRGSRANLVRGSRADWVSQSPVEEEA